MGLSILGGANGYISNQGSTLFFPISGTWRPETDAHCTNNVDQTFPAYPASPVPPLLTLPDSCLDEASNQFDLRIFTGGRTAQFSAIAVYVSTNEQATDCSFTLRITGVSGALTVTIPAGATGWFISNRTLVDTVSATAKLCFMLSRVGGETGEFDFASLQLMLQTSEATGTEAPTFWTTSVRNSFGFGDAVQPRPPESFQVPELADPLDLTSPAFDSISRIVGADLVTAYGDDAYEFPYETRTYGTVGYLQTYIKTNRRDTDIVITLVKNGVDTALSITLPAMTTGFVIDATHQIAYSPGDRWTLRFQSGACTVAAMLDFSLVQMLWRSSDKKFEVAAGGNAGVAVYDVGQQIYAQSTTENSPPDGGIRIPFDAVISDMHFAYTNFGLFAGFTDAPFSSAVFVNGVKRSQVTHVATPGAPDANGFASAVSNDMTSVGDIVTYGFAADTPDADYGSEFDVWGVGLVIEPATLPTCSIGC